MNPIRTLLHQTAAPPPNAFTRTEAEYQEMQRHARKWEERAKKNRDAALQSQTHQHQAEVWRMKAGSLEEDNKRLTRRLLDQLETTDKKEATR